MKSIVRPVGHVWVAHYRLGKIIDKRDLGIGVVTNVGVMAMANDFAWAAPSGAPINTLALAKWVATGTGTTPAAATDIALQAWDSISPVSGTQSLLSAANVQAYRVVATVNYTGTEAVTEFGLFTDSTLSATTGTPWTAGSATSGTATGTPYTPSSSTVQGQEQHIFEDTTAASPFYGLCVGNTSSIISVPAWYKIADGTAAGAVPQSGDALVIRPVMLDHKTFSAINVSSGDSIQWTYTLTLPSGS